MRETKIREVNITCVDPRMAQVLKQIPGATAATPGALVHNGVLEGLHRKIGNASRAGYDTVSINLLTHEDCGAVRVALGAMRGEFALSRFTTEQLVTPLEEALHLLGLDPQTASLQQAIAVHHALQEGKLAVFVEQLIGLGRMDVTINAERGPVPMPEKPSGDPILVIAMPSQMPRERLNGWRWNNGTADDVPYYLQNPGLRLGQYTTVIADMEVAYRLGISDVTFAVRAEGKREPDAAAFESFANYISRGDVVERNPFLATMRVK